jgi:primosomal protein N' (replication factor Y)
MAKTVKVVVDLALRKLDKEFDYLVPEELVGKLKIGQLVKVPFGRQKLAAFITELNSQAELPAEKLKYLDKLLYSTAFFDNKLLNLFKWTATYFHAYLIQVIKIALPPGITTAKVSRKEVSYLHLEKKQINVEIELQKLKKRAPKQYQIMQYLVDNQPQDLSLKEVVEYANTSRQTVYRLIDKSLVSVYDNIVRRVPDLIGDNYQIQQPKLEVERNLKKLLFQLETFVEQKAAQTVLLTKKFANPDFDFIFNFLKKMIELDKNVIILIPEIDKNFSLLKKLQFCFKEKVAFLYSQLSDGERFDEWQRILSGKVKIVAGARSAVFAPLTRVDVIILLDEGKQSYKSQEHPLYHARQVASRRLREEKGLLVLESAAPAVESNYLAKSGQYKLLKLPDKKEVKPKLESKLIDLAQEVEAGNLGDLSRELIAEIENTLSAGKQIILFLNRRGAGNYLICKKCAAVIKCANCDIALNYHQNKNLMICHHCGYQTAKPAVCPECGSKFLSLSGSGTQSIIQQLQEEFPAAKILRFDTDSELKRAEILTKAREESVDIIVGTSMLIKYDYYQRLGLIGVVSADTALNNSNFRAAEETFALLTELKTLLNQSQGDKLLIQSFRPDHYSLQSALAGDYQSFYQKEIDFRQISNYPPFCRLLNIIIQGPVEKKIIKLSHDLNKYLLDFSDYYLEKTEPGPAILGKIRNKYRWQILLKFNSIRKREYLIRLIENKFLDEKENQGETEIRIDVDPYQML